MLDVGHIISALGRTSTASNQVKATSSSAVSETSIAIPTKAEPVYVTSRIRIDNLQDVAILEYRSETGEVKDQFPTQKQIEAFKLTQQRLDNSEKATATPTIVSTESTYKAPQPSVSVRESVAPKVSTPVPVAITAPAPSTPAPSAPSAPSVDKTV